MAIEIRGVMPLPPQNPMIGPVPARMRNAPDGLVTSTTSPSETWSSNQLETAPPGTRLTVTARSSSVSGALDIE